MSAIERVASLVRTENPFTYRGAITETRRFFDRHSELESALVVCEQIRKGSTGGVLVSGGRGTGKTSFLYALKSHLERARIACALISLDEGMVASGNEPRFFKLILNDLTTACENADLIQKEKATQIRQLLQGVIKLDSVKFEAFGLALVAKTAESEKTSELPYTILRDGLRDLLRTLKPKDNTRGAMLLLDEGDALTQNKVLLEVLRNVFQETPGMGLVIAGTSNLLTQVSTVFSPMQRFFRSIELGPFPTEEDVVEAITKTVEIAKTELLSRAIHLDVIMHSFVPEVIELSGRDPLQFNLLSYFAWDTWSPEVKYENEKATLYLRLDNVLEQAMRQLRGTTAYTAFLDSLTESDVGVLTLLSKCPHGASVDELTILLVLDTIGENLRSQTIDQIVSQLGYFKERREPTEDILNKIRELGEKTAIRVLSQELGHKTIYRVEDQWIKTYFKYRGVNTLVNLELGLIAGESGVLFFGDPVSSVLDSAFLHRVLGSLDSSPPFKVNSYPNEGDALKSISGKILNASFIRTADGKPWHLAFHLKRETETKILKDDIAKLIGELKELGLVKAYSVKDRVGSGPWLP